MTQNFTQLWPEIFGVVGTMAVLFLFALAIVLPSRSKTPPGIRGHREASEETEHEEIRPDGYIDSFAKEIEEAGGGLPVVIKLALPGIIVWWLLYLIINWAQR
jgi:hypothetical protein